MFSHLSTVDIHYLPLSCRAIILPEFWLVVFPLKLNTGFPGFFRFFRTLKYLVFNGMFQFWMFLNFELKHMRVYVLLIRMLLMDLNTNMNQNLPLIGFRKVEEQRMTVWQKVQPQVQVLPLLDLKYRLEHQSSISREKT